VEISNSFSAIGILFVIRSIKSPGILSFIHPPMDVSSPPQYRRFSRPASGTGPPAYTRCNTILHTLPPPPEPTEHVFQVADGKCKPWIKLTLRSSARSAKSLPTFFEKENINGQLEVDAERGDSIQAITATVRLKSLLR
jgi:hypothetical protein